MFGRTPLLAHAPNLRGWLLLVGSLFTGACGDDVAPAGNSGPTGNPSFGISSPKNGDCISIGDDPDARIPVVVQVDELWLRPTGACGTITQCGHLELSINGVPNNTASGTAIDVLLRKLAKPTGEHVVVVNVVNDDGDPVLKDPEPGEESGKPLTATLLVTAERACPMGSGGTTGGGGAGGMTGGGGAGGMTGGGGAGGMTGGVGGS